MLHKFLLIFLLDPQSGHSCRKFFTFFRKPCKDTTDLLGDESVVSNPIGEVSSLKKLLTVCMLALIIGCSASNPTITDSSISSSSTNTATVVWGQRVLLQVNAVTDNPPFTYIWNVSPSDGNATLTKEDTLYAALWIAPETSTPRTYTITCQITDKENKHATQTFTVTVNPRPSAVSIITSGVLSIAKQIDSKIGGIWVSILDGDITFISSNSNEANTSWKKNFNVMIARSNPSTMDYDIWGVDYASSGNTIVKLAGTTETDIACATCNHINTLSEDISNTANLWVGDNSGLHYYNSANTTTPWSDYNSGEIFNDLFEGTDYVYAASTLGIYVLNEGPSSPNSINTGIPGAVTAICTVDGVDGSGNATHMIWAVVPGQGVIQEKSDGTFRVLPDQPRDQSSNLDVASSLDVDPSGNIWCGKYYRSSDTADGTPWTVVPGLESVTINKSVASGEGLIYLLSDSRVLYRW
jgi:hypothetical protein